MIEFELTLRVDRPLDEVFGIWADPGRIPTWQGSAESVQVQGEPGPGCSWSVVRRTLGTRQTMTARYTAFEPGRRLVEEGIAGPAKSRAETLFEASGAGTSVRTRVSVELGGALGRLGARVTKGSIIKQAREDQQRLKALIEG